MSRSGVQVPPGVPFHWNTNRRASPFEAFGDFQLLATALRAEADVLLSLTQPRDLTPSACMWQGRRVPKRLQRHIQQLCYWETDGCRFESCQAEHKHLRL